MSPRKCAVFLLLVATTVTASMTRQSARPAIVGRWDVTMRDEAGEHPSWLEILEKDGRLTGRFIGQRGSLQNVTDVRAAADGRVEFVVGHENSSGNDLRLSGVLQSDRMSGTATEANKRYEWAAVRAPSLARSSPPRWGRPFRLFNGKDLTGWKSHPAGKTSRWEVREGVLFNAGSGAGLVSERKFDDFRLQLEYKIEPGSDSGVYLRGRYEIEIEDSYGKSPDEHLLGSIYGLLKPTSLPAKRATEWQTIDATLVGRKVTVILNGETIINEQEIPGITGGALDSDEKSPGPIMLQGDYGQVSYRNIVVTPAMGDE